MPLASNVIIDKTSFNLSNIRKVRHNSENIFWWNISLCSIF